MELILLLIFSFIIRILFILTKTSDTDFHIWNIKLRNTLKRLRDHHSHDSLVKGYRGYPPLPHEIIRLFPQKYQVAIGRFINSIYDLLSIVITYFAAQYLFVNYWGLPQATSPSTAFMVALIFSTTPKLFPVNSRLNSIGGRPIGLTLNILYFLLLFLVLQGYYLAVPFLILTGISIILSSQFGMQNLIGVSVLATLLMFRAEPLVMLILVFGVGFTIPHFGFKALLVRKIAHFRWYIKNMESGNTATGRNRFSDIIRLPYTMFTDFGQFLYQVTTKITPIIAITSMPLLFALVYFVLNNSIFLSDIFQDQILFYLAVLTVADCILFILTSLKPFLFLGEAERYLEFCIMPVVIMFIYYIYVYTFSPEKTILLVLLIQLCIIIFNFLYLKSEEFSLALRWYYDNDLKEVVDFLEKSGPQRIITIPVKTAYAISALTKPKHQYYYNLFYEEGRGLEYQNEDIIYFQLIRPEIDYFYKKYKISMLITHKKRVEFAKTKGIDYKLHDKKPLYENANYAVYRVDDLI